MRIPIGDLEQARRDPVGYRKQQEGEPRGFRPSRYSDLVNAVYRFHELQGRGDVAREYLAQRLAAFRSQAETPEYLEHFDAYVADFQALNRRVFRIRNRLCLSVPDGLQDLSVTGRIPRLDLTETGCAAVLFTREATDHSRELRLPLIQGAYTRELLAQRDEVIVTVYEFQTGIHRDYQFSPDAVQAAQREFRELMWKLAG